MASSAIGAFEIGVSPIGGPPLTPGLTATLPSYLYWEYRSATVGPNGIEIEPDPNLPAFIDAYNELTQEYVDWFNTVILPDYTNQYVSGLLLDWVGQGLYGIVRPSLGIGTPTTVGPFNTWALNTLPFNTQKSVGPSDFYALNDDYYRRVITWHVFKGDGKYFSIRWLKRRVLRFLTGENGTNVDTSATYRISVTFGPDYEVTIRLVSTIASVTGGAILNGFGFNTTAFNQLNISTVSLPPYAAGPTFKAAVEAGVLSLPFQYSWTVTLS